MKNNRANKRIIQRRRRTVFAFLLSGILLTAMAIPVFADTLPKEDPGWYVTLSAAGKMQSNFSSDKLDETISGMQPGDEAVFRITVNNDYNDAIDWYMENAILYSLEDRSANKGTAGGGYTYRLTYTDPNGKVNTLFDSDRVGGDTVSPAGQGLNGATSGLENWFLMDKMKAKTKGLIELHVLLDGETQGNNYQDTLADLKLNFAVELPGAGSFVKTGDTNNLLLYIILMAAAAFLVILLITIRSYANRRRAKR